MTSTTPQQFGQLAATIGKHLPLEICQSRAGLPATVWEYSRATDVLGRLVEVISGQTLRAFLQEHIFEPLGMLDTDFSVHPGQHHRIAEPFGRDPDGAPRMRVFNVCAPAAFESGGAARCPKGPC